MIYLLAIDTEKSWDDVRAALLAVGVDTWVVHEQDEGCLVANGGPAGFEPSKRLLVADGPPFRAAFDEPDPVVELVHEPVESTSEKLTERATIAEGGPPTIAPTAAEADELEAARVEQLASWLMDADDTPGSPEVDLDDEGYRRVSLALLRVPAADVPFMSVDALRGALNKILDEGTTAQIVARLPAYQTATRRWMNEGSYR